jgi:starch synthase
VDINGLLDRQSVYGYGDDSERFTAFQIAVVDWIAQWRHQPDIVHVHDHHTGLIPFMMQHCSAYKHLAQVATVLTIHNAQYQGWMSWDKSRYLPDWDNLEWGKLDWENNINPLASAVKCARQVTTVSQSYLEEMRQNANGLEKLFDYEQGKCIGILNGIDTAVWDPCIDSYINPTFNSKNAALGKLANKKQLCDQFNLDLDKPLFIFIGRLVYEKAADLLPQVIYDSIFHMEGKVNFLVLGSGEHSVEAELENMKSQLVGFYNSTIGYNEKLSHQMYAGADFLIMPSRVEPCGLNQLYAMRYGTIPIVRNTGGLRDTVKDFGEPKGYGICFNDATVWDITYSIHRALEIYHQPKLLKKLVTKIMKLDFSWQTSAVKYIELYESIRKF